MTFHLIVKYRKQTLAIILVFCVFILVNRDNSVVEEQIGSAVPKLSTIFHGESSTEQTTLKPSNTDKDFNVFDHRCKIPRINPFSADVMSIFKTEKFKECTDQPDLISVLYDGVKRQYVVHVNESVFVGLFPGILRFSCIYYEVLRGANDSITWCV